MLVDFKYFLKWVEEVKVTNTLLRCSARKENSIRYRWNDLGGVRIQSSEDVRTDRGGNTRTR